MGREGRRGKGKGGENDLTHPLSQIPGYATASMSAENVTKMRANGDVLSG